MKGTLQGKTDKEAITKFNTFITAHANTTLHEVDETTIAFYRTIGGDEFAEVLSWSRSWIPLLEHCIDGLALLNKESLEWWKEQDTFNSAHIPLLVDGNGEWYASYLASHKQVIIEHSCHLLLPQLTLAEALICFGLSQFGQDDEGQWIHLTNRWLPQHILDDSTQWELLWSVDWYIAGRAIFYKHRTKPIWVCSTGRPEPPRIMLSDINDYQWIESLSCEAPDFNAVGVRKVPFEVYGVYDDSYFCSQQYRRPITSTVLEDDVPF